MSVTKVCIDDFALKKREKYATVMIDIDTHKIIDMIASRELNDVTKWLKSYPNLSVVSRDGSLTYRNAITKSHPEAIQVSDRFHILKNLTTYCKDFLKKHLKSKVIVDELNLKSTDEAISSKQPNDYTVKEKYNLVSAALSAGEKISKSCKKYHIDIRLYKKLEGFTCKERASYFSTKHETRTSDKEALKLAIAIEVRETYKEVKSIREVSRKHNLNRKTIKKYLADDFSPVHGSTGARKASILDPYKKIINEQIKLGVTSTEIYKIIREDGYTGSYGTLTRYRGLVNKTSNESSKTQDLTTYEYVDRKLLMKLLYKNIKEVKGLTSEMVKKVYGRDNIFEKVIKLVAGFRDILKKKKVNMLEQWIKTAQGLKIDEIDSFVNGLLRDIDAIKNAVIYDYNNGLAEGKINKLKVTKRIMYGRCGFDLLKKKSLRLEF